MARGIIAKKIGMTQIFDENGKIVPVTVLRAGPCVVTQVKTPDVDQYEAIQLAFEPVREKSLTRPEAGHFKKNGSQVFRYLKEFRETGLDAAVGTEIKADVFAVGDKVKVTGVSKGKGFQGVMKRHGFGGGRATHGSKFHRAPGSMGASAYPSKVFKGKKLPGQTGNKVVTTTNLEVVRVDTSNNLIMLRGSVPGPRTTVLKVEAMKS